MPKIFIEMSIDNFEEEYNNKYLKSLNKFEILRLLNLDPSTPIKKNGTWSRNLIVMKFSTLNQFRVKIQKFEWRDSNNKPHYVSVFPSFIFKYNPVHADLIEHIASNLKKDENIFNFVDDNQSILDSGDLLINGCYSAQRNLSKLNIFEKLIITYTEKFNELIAPILSITTHIYKFPHLYCIILISSCLYKTKSNTSSNLNSLIY
jgi:hypothetical protein